MGRRGRRRQAESGEAAARVPEAVDEYEDAEGNRLTLRRRLSAGSVRQLARLDAAPAATAEDRWQRREELLFERLAVRWEIAGLPLEGQRELLGRYRLADGDTRRWVRATVDEHLRRHLPEAVA